MPDTMMQAFIPEQYEQPIIVKLLPTAALYRSSSDKHNSNQK